MITLVIFLQFPNALAPIAVMESGIIAVLIWVLSLNALALTDDTVLPSQVLGRYSVVPSPVNPVTAASVSSTSVNE